MRPEDLLNRLEDRPFRPFRIHMSDGAVFDVTDPGTLMVGRSTAVLPARFGTDEEGRRLAESWRTISLLHITQISDVEETSNGQSSNGS